MQTAQTRTVRLRIFGLENSDLLVATSDEVPGLRVGARSLTDLQQRIPLALRELLEAQGETVLSVGDARGVPAAGKPGYRDPSRYEATLCVAAP